ncbi:MAG: FG-GAP-like repeat-containing protein [Alphaproteobacteria bacterium]|nr:FG-GAP-like repeat-containing protein [Alphaproteobacteria bacterium]
MIRSGWGKPCVILLFFLVAVLLYFWLSSRYPSLNAKAVLNTSAPLSALGFDPVVEIKDSFTTFEKIFWNTVNWMNTNLKGMSFSFVFGSFFLALMPCLNLRQSLSGFKSALLGLGIGAPLGVCVNCAAPIARAMQASGHTLQTALAALIASPSLNIVVIMMAFSLFPFHMVATRLVFVLLFILVLIPLACHFLFKREVIIQKSGEKLCKTISAQGTEDIVFDKGIKGWGQAALWAFKAYIIAFLTLLKIAFPLMILAGFLGGVAVTVLPWEMFHTLNMDLNAGMLVLVMFVLALFGTILPSPIAFDVILSSVLLQVGVPMPYVAVLFFTLGTFSIYALFIVWQAVSFRVAAFLFLTTAGLGVLAGGSAFLSEEYLLTKAGQEIKAATKTYSVEMPSTADEFDPVLERSEENIVNFAALSFAMQEQRFDFVPMSDELLQKRPEDIRIMQHDFIAPPENKQNRFTRLYGEELGIEQPYLVSYTSFFPDDLVYVTMSIASGDVHNDGWPDLLVMGDHDVMPNIMLYSNLGGEEFKRQFLPVTADMGMVVLVSLADLNADGWLDIVFATYNGTNYVIYNDKGEFKGDHLEILHDREGQGITMSLGFADIDLDGDLDIFEGNWSDGALVVNQEPSRDYILKATEEGYEPVRLEKGVTGETLTSIFGDFNEDGFPDLYIGNDYIIGEISDQLLLGDGKGGFVPYQEAQQGMGIQGGQSTMSTEFTDIDNDLKPDFYIGQIAYSGQYMHAMSKIAERQISYSDFCDVQGIKGLSKEECLKDMTYREALIRAAHFITDACDVLQDKEQHKKCLAHMLHFKKNCFFMDASNDQDNLDLLKAISERYLEICARDDHEEDDEEDEIVFDYNIPVSNLSLHNVLLRKKGAENSYTENANSSGIGYGAWSWNSRFADVNNDGWKDLYIANGNYFPMALASNVFYVNKGNGSFEDKTKEAGLEDYTVSSAYTYVDYDRDGDLDIITVPMDTPLTIYRNENNGTNNAIVFALEDRRSKNIFGYGAKVLISYEVDGNTMQQRQDIQGSGGYKSFNAPEAHFGLGNAQNVTRVSVEWPDGGQSVVEGIFFAGKLYKIIRE